MDLITLIVTSVLAALTIVVILQYKAIKILADFLRTFDLGKLITAYEMNRQERDQEELAKSKVRADVPIGNGEEPSKDQQIRWYEIQLADLDKRNKMLERENQRLRMAAENRQVESDAIETVILDGMEGK